ncbi:hypothetical protein G6F57_002221 [Rhizopus arrhizus]|uniref:Succinate dehydrogenase [ubiquinone] cytochrome b small subunit n=1 Tax=Rhizopus oryzae TaxID=64495 RepID=A0A9P6XJT0_RHIOR|nr:hypothetical protein G6F23_002401 [Rhizopus arrhizus]KAG1425830.1 hypothetical protein G6F58_001760 [Rhizopus delemar]KAG0768698.1 hypothetical protein G6F24_001719 [Rhizopus arrhizus]KAG0791442.1 hypothetical protein G6F21_005085 [Rhizopus arrhizus]KAG0802197.1 hypothetical protein G6F22_000503 [Rhizopus arrhizus]
MAIRSVLKSAGLASSYRLRIGTVPSVLHLKKPYSATTSTAAVIKSTSEPAAPIPAETPENKVTDDQLTEKKKKEKTPKVEHGYQYGAHHWNLERAAAVALIPLISTQMTYGAHPIVDGLFGVVLPYHLYLGFESCIIDYIPKRVYPRLHKAAKWTLGTTTGLVMWGCYEFNTNDIGITEFMQRLFAA